MTSLVSHIEQGKIAEGTFGGDKVLIFYLDKKGSTASEKALAHGPAESVYIGNSVIALVGEAELIDSLDEQIEHLWRFAHDCPCIVTGSTLEELEVCFVIEHCEYAVRPCDRFPRVTKTVATITSDPVLVL